ncbi:MAG: hypothetical protein Q4C98_06670 [Capnocytophaga sp.]|nr:hypothetical protein [Capnocytophaga sp.]
MKKVFFCIALILGFISCSQKEDNPIKTKQATEEESEMDKLKKELGIANDLENESTLYFPDGRFFLVGKKDNELYFYNVDGYNKKIIAQHKEVLPKEIEVILDNGDKKIFEGKDYYPSVVSKFCENDKDQIFWGTVGLEKYPEYQSVTTKLYIFDKKFKFLDNITLDDSFYFHPLCIRRINDLGYLLNNEQKTYVYDFDYNFLYQYEYTKFPNIGKEIFENGEPITAEEFIIINNDDIKRVNLKEDKLIWSINKYNSKLFYSSLPENTRFNSKKISKDGNIWTITEHYTKYSGEKGSGSFKIDINKGEILD